MRTTINLRQRKDRLHQLVEAVDEQILTRIEQTFDEVAASLPAIGKQLTKESMTADILKSEEDIKNGKTLIAKEVSARYKGR